LKLMLWLKTQAGQANIEAVWVFAERSALSVISVSSTVSVNGFAINPGGCLAVNPVQPDGFILSMKMAKKGTFHQRQGASNLTARQLFSWKHRGQAVMATLKTDLQKIVKKTGDQENSAMNILPKTIQCHHSNW